MTRPAMSVLDPAGPQAGSIASLWWVFEWLSIAVYVIVVAVFIVAMVKAERRFRALGDGDPLARDHARERRMTRVIVLSAATTVLILFLLLISSIRTGAKLASLEDRPDALAIRITAHQWWWQIEYSADDPRRYVSTANELHLPVGRPVHVELTSGDVIHSFWVPSVHGKKDLIPGRINKTWIEVDEPGVFEGQCAEFCGLEHAKMRLAVIAESPEAFEAWRHHEQETAHAPETPLEHRGQQIFLGSTCGTCHEIAGTPAGGRLGPELTHLAERTTIGAGAALNNRGNLGGWLLDPQSVKPGVHMPATSLSADDFNALLAYLESLQ